MIFNVAFLVAMFAVAETYCTFGQMPRPIYSEPYMVPDDVLGTVPVKETRAHSSEFKRGKLIYDVNYTIDSNGLRVGPPSKTTGSVGSILFFGCSFTFGEGLPDEASMPYQVGILSSGYYKTYNFGFHGYGPHQMLAAIESGRVRQVVDTPPRYAIYQALPDHVARVAGKIPYGKHSPRYQLDKDGTVRLQGHFDDGQAPASAFEAHVIGQFGKSAIYRTLKSLEPRTNEYDVRLLLAVVRKSRDLLAAEYPGIEFHIILRQNFAYEQTTYRELQEGFREMGIQVHLVEDILPDYNANPQKYWLNRDDRHPNALQDYLLAKYVVTKVLSRSNETPSLGPPKDTSGLSQ